tara:strand:+ start:1385 stop:1783 length:399 start_codon:yes stop_codon:yes gene_type:complete
MSVRAGQAKLRKLAKHLHQGGELSVDDRDFLVSSLLSISDGEDAETALGVKARRGERKSKQAKDTKRVLEFVYGWLASAIAPEKEGGLGLTLKDAVPKLKAEWRQLPSEKTLLRYWNDRKDTQERDFKIKTD